MISLLHEKEYELLGNLEIREADWLRIRRLGLTRFVFDCCRSSYSGRIGAGLLLLAAVDGLDAGRSGGAGWLMIVFGAYGVVASAVYAVAVWRRLERRFPPEEQNLWRG
jgi:hypothetical protein